MRAANPPIVATWLLERLYTGDESESLIGDLVECYGRSRSKAWYWRQVLAAIVLSFCREVRGHILLAIRAVVTGWLAFFMFRFISLGMLSRLHLDFQLPDPFGQRRWRPSHMADLLDANLDGQRLVLSQPPPAARGIHAIGILRVRPALAPAGTLLDHSLVI